MGGDGTRERDFTTVPLFTEKTLPYWYKKKDKYSKFMTRSLP